MAASEVIQHCKAFTTEAHCYPSDSKFFGGEEGLVPKATNFVTLCKEMKTEGLIGPPPPLLTGNLYFSD